MVMFTFPTSFAVPLALAFAAESRWLGARRESAFLSGSRHRKGTLQQRTHRDRRGRLGRYRSGSRLDGADPFPSPYEQGHREPLGWTGSLPAVPVTQSYSSTDPQSLAMPYYNKTRRRAFVRSSCRQSCRNGCAIRTRNEFRQSPRSRMGCSRSKQLSSRICLL